MSIENVVAQNLLQIKAIKLSPQNPFTWASGMRSPIYCDNRISLSFPAVRNIIINGFVELSNKLDNIDMVCGVATAGIPHGAILADRMNLPFSYVRASAKSHGRQNQIEGEIPQGSNILVVEDLISTGGSSLEAVEVLRNNDHKVAAVFAIFNYGFDIAKENFKNASCPFYSLTDYEALLKEAVESNYITTEEKNILSNWSDDPSNWYNNNFKN